MRNGLVLVFLVGCHSAPLDAVEPCPMVDAAPAPPPTTEFPVHSEMQLGVSPNHSCALAGGKLFCWGRAEELGAGLSGGTVARPRPRAFSSPIPVGGQGTRFVDWTRLAVGSPQSCGLRSDGSLWCWGRGSYPEPVVAPSARWQAVAAGDHTCAVSDEGALYCWSAREPTPTRLGSDQDWREVVVGSGHDCGFRRDGSLWCWESAAASERVPARIDGEYLAASAGGDRLCAIAADGRIFCWRPGSAPTAIPGTDYRVVSSGLGAICAIRSDRTLWCMGEIPGRAKRAFDMPTQIGDAADWDGLALGTRHACARKLDGRIFCFGENGLGALGNDRGPYRNVPTPLVDTSTHWRQLSLGNAAACGVRSDGSLWCWGNARDLTQTPLTKGQLPVRVGGDTSWTQVSVGEAHACALRGQGELWCWGANGTSQLGDGSTVAASAPQRIGGDADWTSVSAGTIGTCGIRAARLYCWGAGRAAATLSTPTIIGSSEARWNRVSIQHTYGCAIRTDGRLYCWGKLNEPPSELDWTPTVIGSDRTWTDVSVGASTACALDISGAVYCWGQLLTGFGSQVISADVDDVPQYIAVDGKAGTVSDGIAVGAWSACAKRPNRLECWGANYFGQLGDGSYFAGTSRLSIDGIEKVVLGGSSACAQLSDGTALCWGLNGDGQLGNAGVWSDDPDLVIGSPL